MSCQIIQVVSQFIHDELRETYYTPFFTAQYVKDNGGSLIPRSASPVCLAVSKLTGVCEALGNGNADCVEYNGQLYFSKSMVAGGNFPHVLVFDEFNFKHNKEPSSMLGLCVYVLILAVVLTCIARQIYRDYTV